MSFGNQKRLKVQSQLGSCRRMIKPCGLEAHCLQLNITSYTCICPESSEPTTFDFHRLICSTKEPITLKPWTTETNHFDPNQPTTLKPLSTEINHFNPNQPTTLKPLSAETNHFNPNQPNNQTAPISGAVTVMITSLILILIMYLGLSLKNYCKKHQKNGRRKQEFPRVPFQNKSFLDDSESYGISTISPVTVDTAPFMYVNSSSVSLVQEIGQGYFAKVYKGELRHNCGKLETVAIKSLKCNANEEAQEDFRREIETMKYFRHPKILALIGICLKGSGFYPWMIFEYMEFGDLTNVLRNSNDQLRTNSNLPILSKDSLLGISLQIAAGMEYLASQRFIHRDLACRNCLVGHGLTIKISDFGMSRDVYMSDYYKVNSCRLLPLRWMSPECILYKRYTEKSDVWSFGVVLWEIYTFGKQPYYEYSNIQLLKLIPDGELLKIPMDCPQVIYELMHDCWKFFPKERLQFVDVHERLKNAYKDQELNDPLSQQPLLKDIINHPIVKKIRAKEFSDDENNLKPVEPQNNVEL